MPSETSSTVHYYRHPSQHVHAAVLREKRSNSKIFEYYGLLTVFMFLFRKRKSDLNVESRYIFTSENRTKPMA